jgi:hypothetical protein
MGSTTNVFRLETTSDESIGLSPKLPPKTMVSETSLLALIKEMKSMIYGDEEEEKGRMKLINFSCVIYASLRNN